MESSSKPISAILLDVVRNFQEIVRSEVRLAKAEVREEAAKAGGGGALIATGAVLGVFGLLFLLLSAVYALSTIMPEWQAALIVAAVLMAVGGILTAFGLRKLNRVRVLPGITLRNVKENVRWAKAHVK